MYDPLLSPDDILHDHSIVVCISITKGFTRVVLEYVRIYLYIFLITYIWNSTKFAQILLNSTNGLRKLLMDIT